MGSRSKLVDLEPYEIRLLIELLFKYRNSLRGEWGSDTIALLLNTLSRAYGPKGFDEDYPEIADYISDEIGEG